MWGGRKRSVVLTIAPEARFPIRVKCTVKVPRWVRFTNAIWKAAQDDGDYQIRRWMGCTGPNCQTCPMCLGVEKTRLKVTDTRREDTMDKKRFAENLKRQIEENPGGFVMAVVTAFGVATKLMHENTQRKNSKTWRKEVDRREEKLYQESRRPRR